MVRFARFVCLGIALFFSALASAQITDVTNMTSTPIPGVGHDYIKMLSETVNPANGAVSLRIQVPTPPGRHMSLPFAFAYDSNGAHHIETDGMGTVLWWDNTAYIAAGGWSYSVPMEINTELNEPCTQGSCGPATRCVWDNDFVFQDGTGGRHSLYLAIDQNPTVCQFATPIIPMQVYSGGDNRYRAAITGPSSPLLVADSDGTVYSFPCCTLAHRIPVGGGTPPAQAQSAIVSSIEDRNGNKIGVADHGSGNLSVTDTLGRTMLSTSGFGTTGNTVTVSGLSGPYTVTWGTASSNYAVGQQLVSPPNPFGCSNISNDVQTLKVITKITLPNNTFYAFSYDPTYGSISKITYPNGGYVSYSYGLNPLSEDAKFEGLQAQGSCEYIHDSAAVLHRYVSFDGSTIALQQDFTYSTTWGGGIGLWSAKSTTVTTTDKVTGQSFTTAYTYGDVKLRSQPNDQTAFSGQAPVERSVVYKNTSGSVIQTVAKTWADVDEMASQTTTLENGLTSKTTYTYGPGGQITEQDHYDYGSGAPGPLLRKTTTTYQAFAATPIFPSTASIFDRSCKVVTYDGSNNVVAETDATYDGGTTVCGTAPLSALSGTGSYTGHDETLYGTTATVPRGNLTQKISWLNGGVSPTTTYTYDETGQVLTVKDPCGNGTCSDMTGSTHTTTYSYADSYTTLSGGSNVAYVPAVNTNAYLSKITDPLGHAANFTYDFNNGQLTVSKDPNLQSTTAIYNDSLSRPTQVNYPDGGQIEHAYNDTLLSATVTTCQLISGTAGATCSPTTPPPGWKTTVAAMDGVGHVVQSQLASDPDGITYSGTTYDGFGREYKATNPYRSTSDATYGLTTHLYDVLGRTCLVVPPDFAATAPTSCPTTAPAGEAFTSYSGNLTTVNDEIGNQRTSQTDGLGRLTAVWEAPNRTGYNFETQYQYDALSNMICAVQKGTDTTAFTTCAAASATWRPRSFIYDSLSRLTSATNPESGTISYAYDLNSNLSSKVAPRAGQTGSGQTTTSYFYDVLNRLYEKSYANPAAPVVIYGYDGVAPTGCVAVLPPTITSPTNLIGERSSMCAQYSASSWSFDQLGRPLIESRTNKGSATTNYVVNNTYYKDGSQKTLTYPSGDIVTYTVSAAGRFTQLSDSGNSYVGYSGNTATYAPPGSLATMTNGHTGTFAGIVTSNTFNDRMQPVLLSTSVSSTAIISLCYDFHLGVAVSSAPCSFGAYTSGNNSNVFQVLNNIDSTRSTTFQYDYLNRLSQANTINTTSANCWGETYTIDPWGNLTNRAAASGMGGSCTTELLNDAPATAKNQLNGPLYDAAGNVTNDGNGNLPTYSAENRIATVAGVTYQYDADGTRIEKSSGTMYWPGPGGEILTETTLAGTINEEYVYFDGARIARVDRPSGTVHYYFSDKLGSASVIASSSGTVQEQYFSYPYGGMKSSIGSDPNHFKFTGKERDTESNLDEFGARYYASSTGRFMTPDWAARATSVPYAVFGDPQSLNLYTYVENAPVNRVDADGHTIARQAPADDDITTIMWDTKVDDEAENGNGTTTLAQDTVTVEQVKGQGANVFDHAAISVNGQQAVGLEQKTDSGTAAVEDKTTPGAVKAVDPKREVKDKAVIQVTPEQAAKIQKFLDNSKQNPPNYNLYRSNCAQFCESALRAGGVKNVPNDVLPHRLVEDLKGSPSIVDYIRMVPIPSIY